MGSPPGLFVIREDGSLVGLAETPYDSEALLQQLLASYPDLMAGAQIDPAKPRRWLLITRELGVPDEVGAADRWSLDHLFVDQDGVPTLVEVKRSTDTRIRREVVGQMLDYAANAVLHWPVETIRAEFERRCELGGKSAEEELDRFLAGASTPDAFWLGVKTNLQAGRIRLLFVADAIPVELRRVIEFLNQQMNAAEVLGIEVRNYVGEGIRTLAPRVFGQTAQAEQRRSTGAPRRDRPWDKESFFAKLAERQHDAEMSIARALFSWASSRVTKIDYGSGVKMASFIPVLELGESWFGPFRVYTGYRTAYVEIPLGSSGMRAPPFNNDEQKWEFVRRLNAIPGIKIHEELGRFPGIDLEALSEGDRIEQFLSVMDWAVEAVKAAHGRSGF
jgi:hypothetical protein